MRFLHYNTDPCWKLGKALLILMWTTIRWSLFWISVTRTMTVLTQDSLNVTNKAAFAWILAYPKFLPLGPWSITTAIGRTNVILHYIIRWLFRHLSTCSFLLNLNLMHFRKKGMVWVVVKWHVNFNILYVLFWGIDIKKFTENFTSYTQKIEIKLKVTCTYVYFI